MITSDLYFLDDVSVLRGALAHVGDLTIILDDGLEGTIEFNVSPGEVLNLTDYVVYGVDLIVKA
ncbi:hypothetical protein [Sphingobacterium sp.]|uniref:hypothetical protein n=1 Tax=Sphingobacterium sp. TaxID=341027 RepID=UPI00289BF2B4|nr:hypothetical protein [Sphingobacterium sp.]